MTARPSIAPRDVSPDAGGTPPPTERRRDARRRNVRKREVRATTESMRRLPKRVLEIGAILFPGTITDHDRPKTRGECAQGPRPCPMVSCAQHLYLDVSPRTGAIKLNMPDLEVWEMPETCALDVAEEGGRTLVEVADALNLTRERVRQIEVGALAKIERAARSENTPCACGCVFGDHAHRAAHRCLACGACDGFRAKARRRLPVIA